MLSIMLVAIQPRGCWRLEVGEVFPRDADTGHVPTYICTHTYISIVWRALYIHRTYLPKAHTYIHT